MNGFRSIAWQLQLKNIMLVISDQEKSGVSGFYTVLFSERKYIYALDWGKYKRFVKNFVLIDLLFLVCFIYTLQVRIEIAEKLFEISFPLFFGYIFLKLKLCQPRVKILITNRVKKEVAPVSVWLDYFFLGMAGVLLQSLIMRTTSENMYHYWAIFLQVNFFMYSMMPFVTYLKFRMDKK